MEESRIRLNAEDFAQRGDILEFVYDHAPLRGDEAGKNALTKKIIDDMGSKGLSIEQVKFVGEAQDRTVIIGEVTQNPFPIAVFVVAIGVILTSLFAVFALKEINKVIRTGKEALAEAGFTIPNFILFTVIAGIVVVGISILTRK